MRRAGRGPAAGVCVAVALALVLVGCSPPDPQPVTLLAGGGKQHLDDVTGEPAPGREVELPGEIAGLTGTGTGSAVGIIDRSWLLRVEADGAVSRVLVRVEEADGGTRSVELEQVAAAPDGTVYVRVPFAAVVGLHELASVYRLDEENVLRPFYREGRSDRAVQQIAVDPQGRLLVLENVGDTRPGASDFQPYQVRRIEPDGEVTVLAGTPQVSEEPDAQETQTWAHLPEGTPADDLPLSLHTGITVGGDGTLYLSSGTSIAAVAQDGTLRHLAGTGEWADEVLPLEHPLADPVPGDEVTYMTLAPQLGVNTRGDAVATFWADSETPPRERASWQVASGDEGTQEIADAAWAGRGFMLVDAGGGVRLASATGGSAAWLEEDTLVISASDGAQSILVTVDVP